MQSFRLLLVGVTICVALSTWVQLAAAETASSAGSDGAEEPAGTAVTIVHVDPRQLTQQLRAYDTAIVFYYVDYCPVCSRLRPVFARASHMLQRQQLQLALGGATEIKQKLFAAVNCGTNADGCISTGVKRVPTFKRIRNGGRDSELLRFRYVTAQALLEAINA